MQLGSYSTANPTVNKRLQITNDVSGLDFVLSFTGRAIADGIIIEDSDTKLLADLRAAYNGKISLQ